MFGAVYGDVIGSYYENHCTKDYDFPFHKDSTFTDDSVMTAAVCQAILANDKPVKGFKISNRAFEYAVQYKQFYAKFPNAGYGTMFKQWASDRYMGHNRSYGNGGAMRAVPIGYAYDDMEQILLQAKASCLFTHNSHEAIFGAQAVAAAVFMARTGEKQGGYKRLHPEALPLRSGLPSCGYKSRVQLRQQHRLQRSAVDRGVP